jgi:hypothetical protein
MGPIPKPADDELRPEYDLQTLRGGVRGKYYEKYKSRLHVVRLAPEVAAAFPTEESVNRALEMLLQLARQQVPAQSAKLTQEPTAGSKTASKVRTRRRRGG